jgi:hypothetical protein
MLNLRTFSKRECILDVNTRYRPVLVPRQLSAFYGA